MTDVKQTSQPGDKWGWESDLEYERRKAKASLTRQVGAARRQAIVEQGLTPDRLRISRKVYAQLVPELLFAELLGQRAAFMGLRIVIDDEMADGFEVFRAFHAPGRPLTEIKAARANKRRFRAKPSLLERVND